MLPTKRKTATRISREHMRAFKKLAQRIDAQERTEIRTMARDMFRRHGIARELVAQLKARRIANGMSLTELAHRTGIAKSNLSRLENSQRVSPTLVTLQRYAEALGMKVRVDLN